MPRLYSLPRGPHIIRLKEDASVPPAAQPLLAGDLLIFDHIDGMYSFCRRYEDPAEIVHPAAYTEVEVVDDAELVSTDSAGQ